MLEIDGCHRALSFTKGPLSVGHMQSIPPPLYAHVRASQRATAARYRVSYQFLDQFWITWGDHLLSPEYCESRATHVWDCAPDYLQWFRRISHVRVQNLDRHSHYDPHQGANDPTPTMVRLVNLRTSPRFEDFPSMVYACLTHLLNSYLVELIQIHQAVNQLHTMIARTGQPVDVYYRALQTTLEILKDSSVTYRCCQEGP